MDMYNLLFPEGLVFSIPIKIKILGNLRGTERGQNSF